MAITQVSGNPEAPEVPYCENTVCNHSSTSLLNTATSSSFIEYRTENTRNGKQVSYNVSGGFRKLPLKTR